MNRIEEPILFTPESVAALQAAIEQAIKGVHDPDTMQRACDRMDQTREEIFERNGLLNFAVPTIRALRDGDRVAVGDGE
jgi:hypothetical protein